MGSVRGTPSAALGFVGKEADAPENGGYVSASFSKGKFSLLTVDRLLPKGTVPLDRG
jgi:hypothetical protein